MTRIDRLPAGRLTAFLLLVAALSSCGDELDLSFRRPSEPIENQLYDLIDGPLDRPSALDVVFGRGIGLPRAVRVDQSGEWDLVFAVLEGEPVFLPRGYFLALEPSSGILELDDAFEDVTEAPANRELYETEEPVPVVVGATYAIRSRNDPSISLPCRIYAKLDVVALELELARVHVRYLWNPNCDDRNLTPGEER